MKKQIDETDDQDRRLRLCPTLGIAAVDGDPRHAGLGDHAIEVRDAVDARGSDQRFARMMIGSDATSIYVANSNTFQESTLLPWVDLRDQVPALNERRSVDAPPRVLRGRGA